MHVMDRKKFLLFFFENIYYHCLSIIVWLIFNIIDNLRLKTVEGDGELNDEINCVKWDYVRKVYLQKVSGSVISKFFRNL